LESVIVSGRFDAADDWIVENTQKDDIVVTADIPLASRCLKKASRVLDYRAVYSRKIPSAIYWQPAI